MNFEYNNDSSFEVNFQKWKSRNDKERFYFRQTPYTTDKAKRIFMEIFHKEIKRGAS
tara:strand:- start:1517 stop:1687 length:171 start_codon:yes stop_codon:yes gene_type:complete